MAFLSSVSMLISILLQLPTGAFADIFGRRLSCIIGSIIYVIAYLIIGVGPDKYYIMFGITIKGIADAFISGASISLIYDSLKELNLEAEFGRIRSNAVIGGQVAIIISSVLAGYLYEINVGLPYVATAMSFVIMCIMYIGYQEPHIDSVKFSVRSYATKMRLGFHHIFRNFEIAKLSIFYIVVGAIAMSFQFQFNQIYASALGYNEIDKGWLFAIIRFVNAFVVIKLLKLDHFLLKSNPMLRFTLFMIIATLFGAIDFKPFGTVILFMTTLGMTLRLIIFDKLVNMGFESRYRATALSALSMLVSLVYIIIIAISGPIFDKYYAGVMFTALGVFLVIVILPLVIFTKQNE
jgi:MFS family permease